MSYELITGDCLDSLREMPADSVDLVATDPPYGISFMGKQWDKALPDPAVWRECLRVLKPGGSAVVMSGARLDCLWRMCRDIEAAGFELQQTAMYWCYRCVSEDTEVLTADGWQQYDKAIVMKSVLCYNIDAGTFEFHKPRRSFVYENQHPAYRVFSDSTDQLVSRNHRCLVEREGRMVFERAENLAGQTEVPVPILESLHDLPGAIPDLDLGASIAKQDLLTAVLQQYSTRTESRVWEATGGVAGAGADHLPCVREEGLEAACMAAEDKCGRDLFQQVPGHHARRGSEVTVGGRPVKQVEEKLVGSRQARDAGQDDWGGEPRLEGRGHLPQKEGQLRRSVNQVRPVPAGVSANGTAGRVCDGTSSTCSSSCRAMPIANRSGASCQSRRNGQSLGESTTVRDEPTTQTLREIRGTRTTLASVEEVEYQGRMWCIEVPTGAFVARRNGRIFITGNSGFPKGGDLSKMADARAGVDREVVGEKSCSSPRMVAGNGGFAGEYGGERVQQTITAPTTDLAKQLDGWFTKGKVKPAVEVIIWARKPNSEKTELANMERWGVGGVNCGKCMVPFGDEGAWANHTATGLATDKFFSDGETPEVEKSANPAGRFPANLLVTDDALGTDDSRYFSVSAWAAEHGYSDDWASAAQAGLLQISKPSRKEKSAGCEGLPEKKAGGMEARNRDSGKGQFDGEQQYATNPHPTCKPVTLFAYIISFLTKPGATVLDPFCGSGTTGVACLQTGRDFIGCEMEPEYVAIAQARCKHAAAQPAQLAL